MDMCRSLDFVALETGPGESEDRMSALCSRCRILGAAAIIALLAVNIGCSRYEGDPGASRTQQQSEDLQNRIRTTQVDR